MTTRKSLTIGTREIGAGRPCFVIAEAGINHNGDVKIAAELVEAAATGRRRRDQVSDPPSGARDAARRRDGRVRRRVAVRPADPDGALAGRAHFEMRELAKRKGIIFMSTPFSREAADYLERIGVPAFKTGSGELTNIPLQRHIARKGKPMIVSTGMSTSEEIDATVRALESEHANFALMHCTSTYPTPYEHVQLGCIAALQSKYGVPVGFSDHTLGTAISLAAVASGANIFEKHFTASRSLPGPDQQGSMEPKELAALVKDIRAVEQSLGATKQIQPGEQDVRDMALHSVVSIRDVAAGATIAAADVCVKSPGTGIPARELTNVVGRVAKRAIAKDRLVSWDDLV